MKKVILLGLFFLSVNLFAQDFIILKNGDEIEAKVLEINKTQIDYKKFSNPTGPTYHLNKSEIFMIKYASGDKDIFNASQSTSKPTPPPTPPPASTHLQSSNPSSFVYDANIGTPNCQVQKQRGAKIYGNRGNEVFFRQDVVFYGYDMTYARLSNPKRMGESMMLIQKYFNEWNTIFNKDVGYNDLKKWMGKRSMIMGTPVFPNYYKRDFNNFVEYGNFCISFEDLQSIVKSYVLNESQGLGMVINVVNFNKGREYSMAYVTFFDIGSRDILFAVLVTGEAGGGGMAGHWASGIENGVRDIFIDEIYKRKLSNNGMIPSKLRLY